ncbi:MAG: hypothetical protein IIB83_09460 [Bacteroidetes bacterium]|nr:hypothetical protein [Bacteroidota bacterium]
MQLKTSLEACIPFDDFPDVTTVGTGTFLDLSVNGNDITGQSSTRGGTAIAEEVLTYP